MFNDPANAKTEEPRERWLVVLRGEPRQLRKLLKAAWRGYGIRCEAVAERNPLTAEVERLRAEVLRLKATQPSRAQAGPAHSGSR